LFIVQAHSFTQQARLAITLAWVAGYTNILTILTCGHVTSHVSGTTSDLGRFLTEGKWAAAGFLIFLLGTFFAGAALSGFVTEHGRRRGWESIFVLPIAIEAGLLAIFAFGVEVRDLHLTDGLGVDGAAAYLMIGVASTAMGLQNATITRISSGVVRTTHVTGVLTDLGLEFAQLVYWARDRTLDVPPGKATSLIVGLRSHPLPKRLLLLASIIGSFGLGAGLGTLVFDTLPRWAMFPPVLFLSWIIYQDLARPIAEIEPSDLVGNGAGIDLDKRLAVFHLRRGKGKSGRVLRMPNLTTWVERLPETTSVVILDMGDAAQIDQNSALEVRGVLSRLRHEGRHLVLAGLSPEQYQQLRAAATGDLLSPLNACSDLEIAIARGLNLLTDA
jgi:uncharacterized membrane protein YoaK (UPF0700 family)